MRPGFEFLCLPVKGRARSQLCELCGSEAWGRPLQCRAGGEQTLARFTPSRRVQTNSHLVLCHQPQHRKPSSCTSCHRWAARAGRHLGHKLAVRNCHRGEVNCLQPTKAVSSLEAIVHWDSLHIKHWARHSTHQIYTVFLNKAVSSTRNILLPPVLPSGHILQVSLPSEASPDLGLGGAVHSLSWAAHMLPMAVRPRPHTQLASL